MVNLLNISPELWKEIGLGSGQTIYMTIVATLIAYVIGLPLGVILNITSKDGIAPNKVINSILGTIVNILRPVPFLILAIILRDFTRGIVGTAQGSTAMIVPLTISAAPYIARVVESSLSEVSKGKIEAASAMGSSNFKIIMKVLLPESVPSLIANGTIALITVMGYTAMAGAIAGGGLGDIALRYGYYRHQMNVMWITLVLLILIVQVLQEVGLFISKKTDHRIRK